MSTCAREANVVRYTKGHVYRKVTPHALQTTILHGCLQETYSSLTASVRSGFPCKCVSSQFLWVTHASCVHRMVVGIMCVDRCLLSGIKLVAHLERRQFDCGPPGFLFVHVTFVLLWLSQRLWIPQVAHTRSPFQIERQFHRERTLCANAGGHVCD